MNDLSMLTAFSFFPIHEYYYEQNDDQYYGYHISSLLKKKMEQNQLRQLTSSKVNKVPLKMTPFYDILILLVLIIMVVSFVPFGRYIRARHPIECPICSEKDHVFRICETCLKSICRTCVFRLNRIVCPYCKN